jgi:hypothetical protein
MLSNQESENISEIEQILNKDNQYVNIAEGEKKVLRFVTTKRIIEVDKVFNGQPGKQIRFVVTDPNIDNNAEKNFDVGKRSARLIVAKLKNGHTLLSIERIGSKKDTLYIPTSVSAIQ